jgi:hypothetical protein
MKRILFLLCALICAVAASAQVHSYRFEHSGTLNCYNIKEANQNIQPKERKETVIYVTPSPNIY